MENTIARKVKIINVQYLVDKATLNNFVLNTRSDDYIEKLLFPFKWQLKLVKQDAKILSVDKL